MKFLVGLGNPGRQYSYTKHNFGFWILDYFVEQKSLMFQSAQGDYVIAKYGKTTCIKPTLFMNNSGLALLDIQKYFKLNTSNFLIVYDDIDLPLGSIKFKTGGGSGGHKGIESIIYQLKSENFDRLRVGIATDEDMRPSEKFVLSPFREQDNKVKNEMIVKAYDGINYYLTHDIKEVMNKYNEKYKKESNK